MPERKIVYESLAHKTDTGFLVKAPSLERLYIDAGLAVTDQLVTLDVIKDTDKKTVTANAEDKESLMVKWVNELLLLFEKEKFLSKRIYFNKFDGKNISASLFGETYVPTRHGYASEIKMTTRNQVEFGELKEPETGFYARVFLTL